MNVRAISITKPLIENGNLTPEELIVYEARVSNPENQGNHKTAPKLIAFLIEKKHWSPFEMVDITFEVKTSQSIAKQILRHRSFSFQEFSLRYSENTEILPIYLRYESKVNRQSSESNISNSLKDYYNKRISLLNEMNSVLYNDMLKDGIAKECARGVLPLSLSTTMYIKGSVRSWIHYFNVRLEENTQKEHREIATEMAVIFKNHFPIISNYIKL